MLKILIADDERYIRNGLKDLLEAQDGFEVIHSVQNGVEALSAIESEQPDVVITDIRMPKMDGRELAKLLNDSYPKIKKVILSGYEDFSYVHEAMKYGAIDYLLKPVDEQELVSLLRNIEAMLEYEEKLKIEGIKLQNKLNQSLPLLRDNFLRGLFNGSKLSDAEIEDRLEYLDMKIDGGDYCVIIVNFSKYHMSYEKSDAEEINLRACIVRNLAEESILRHTRSLACQDDENVISIISVPRMDPEDTDKFLDLIVGDIHANLKKITKSGCTVCLGSTVPKLSLIKESYENARLALKLKFYNEGNEILKYRDMPRSSDRVFDRLFFDSYIDKFYTNFINAALLVKTENISVLLNEIKSFLSECRPNPNEVLRIFAGLFTMLQKQNSEFKNAIDELYGPDYIYFKAIEQLDMLSDIIRYSIGVYTETIEKIKFHRAHKDKKRVEVVKEFIDKNYSENITLARISELIYASPNYFCEMFKNQTGESFLDYLTRVRIEKAKALLKDMKIKTYEVSSMVGYEDAGYFSKVFKKHIGITPSEYRNLNI